jgi:hypothetical protein
MCDNCVHIYNPDQLESEGRVLLGTSSPAPALEMTWSFLRFHMGNFPQERDHGNGERPDFIGDKCDLCPFHYDPAQNDTDGDKIGDVCVRNVCVCVCAASKHGPQDRCPNDFDPLQDEDSTYDCEDVELMYSCPEYVTLCVDSLLEAENACAVQLESQCRIVDQSAVFHGSFSLTTSECEYCTNCFGTCEGLEGQVVEAKNQCSGTPWREEGGDLTLEQVEGCRSKWGMI